MPHPASQVYQLWGWVNKQLCHPKSFCLQKNTHVQNQHPTITSVTGKSVDNLLCNVWRNLHVELKMLFVPSLLVGCCHCDRMGFFCGVIWRQLEQARGNELGIVVWHIILCNLSGGHNTGQPSLTEWEWGPRRSWPLGTLPVKTIYPKNTFSFHGKCEKNKKSILIIVFYT